MKKVAVVIGLMVAMASSSLAMLSIGVLGGYYSFKDGSASGIGVELGLGLIPFVDTRIVAVYTPGSTKEEALIPATLNLKFGLPGMPIYLDAGVGYVFYTNSNTSVTSPTGAMTYNAALGYEHSLMPFTKLFVQGGFEGMQVKYRISGTEFEKSYSGVGAKYGVRFSI